MPGKTFALNRSDCAKVQCCTKSHSYGVAFLLRNCGFLDGLIALLAAALRQVCGGWRAATGGRLLFSPLFGLLFWLHPWQRSRFACPSEKRFWAGFCGSPG
jgi:hypothetical protein